MGNKTNSNSLSVITINELNNKTHGFRHGILKRMKVKDTVVFEDGTHSSISEKEIDKKEVDVVGKINGENVVLIEIKVNLDETLQESQSKGGQYEKVAKKYNMKLFYIVPDNYNHKARIPNCAEIITWEEILAMEEVKGTGFYNEIIHFAEVSMDNQATLSENIGLFTSLLTKLLVEEGIYNEPNASFNGVVKENVNWFDITDDEEFSLGISSDTGDVYLYVTDDLYDEFDYSKFGTLVFKGEDSLYLKMFNLIEDIEDDDLESDSSFMRKFEKKVKELKKIADENL